MKPKTAISVSVLMLLICTVCPAQTRARVTDSGMIETRVTAAISYPQNETTSVDMAGSALIPAARGKAEVKRESGRTKIKFEISHLQHPQMLGAYYTTYVLWAIAPEGQADNLGELQVTSQAERHIEVTTPYQTFGLIVTAEPHGLVKLPSPAIVAQNVVRKQTKGALAASQIEYRGDSGMFYEPREREGTDRIPDYNTPLLVLSARQAVEIARRAHAQQYADAELRDAEIKLAALEQVWPRQRDNEKRFSGEAQEVIRVAEKARSLAVERRGQANLEAERHAANQTIANAQSEADRAKGAAASYRAALAQSEGELSQARQRVANAQNDADRAKANEELARVQAERARLDATKARGERDAIQQRLYDSIAAILETRSEARGLIVNLSDVLFDTNRATLRPGAKEKLSKLTGILMAYPGEYRLEIEGHADALGSDSHNLRLSEARADTVRDYLVSAGIPGVRIIAVRGFGKDQPVASNQTAVGRQQNRRVEIVISDSAMTLR
jgi:outer membrane protein OmpA-like peptidoglycan-associated protein